MSKPVPIHELLRKIRPLALHHQAAYLHRHIENEQGGNIYKTSVRIRELQSALKDVQARRLKREPKENAA